MSAPGSDRVGALIPTDDVHIEGFDDNKRGVAPNPGSGQQEGQIQEKGEGGEGQEKGEAGEGQEKGEAGEGQEKGEGGEGQEKGEGGEGQEKGEGGEGNQQDENVISIRSVQKSKEQGEAFNFEGFSSVEDLKKAYSSTKEELERFQANSKKSPFHNEMAEKFNSYLAGNGSPENFLMIQSKNIKEMTGEEAIKLQMKLELKGVSDDTVNTLYKDKYNNAHDPETEPELYKQRQSIIDAYKEADEIKAKNELSKFQADTKIEDKSIVEARMKAERAERLEKLQIPVNHVISNFNAVQEKLADGEIINYEVAPHEIQKYATMAIQVAEQKGWQDNAEGRENIRAFIENAYWVNHRRDILQAMYNSLNEKLNQEKFSEKHNTKEVSQKKQADSASQGKSMEEAIMAMDYFKNG